MRLKTWFLITIHRLLFLLFAYIWARHWERQKVLEWMFCISLFTNYSGRLLIANYLMFRWLMKICFDSSDLLEFLLWVRLYFYVVVDWHYLFKFLELTGQYKLLLEWRYWQSAKCFQLFSKISSERKHMPVLLFHIFIWKLLCTEMHWKTIILVLKEECLLRSYIYTGCLH